MWAIFVLLWSHFVANSQPIANIFYKKIFFKHLMTIFLLIQKFCCNFAR